jgi:malic enzyme
LPLAFCGRIREILGDWQEKDVRFIVAADGERILGLGELGAGGSGIPIGEIALRTACAGVPPQYCLRVVLDLGTNKGAPVDDPLISVCGRAASAVRNRWLLIWKLVFPSVPTAAFAIVGAGAFLASSMIMPLR